MNDKDKVLYQAHPSMFRDTPILFLIYCALVPFVVGILLLLRWWIETKCTHITITEKKVILRQGILSKKLNEIRIEHIRNVLLTQSLFQRIMNTGWIGISTSGQSGVELAIAGIPFPARAKQLIDERIR